MKISQKVNIKYLLLKFQITNTQKKMLSDKTQLMNRLQNSSCSTKTNLTYQTIKNPYLMQYKIFQERLKNPKTKSMSLVMRKRKVQIDENKENFKNQIKHFEQEQCLKQAKKVILNDENKFSLFINKTIDYDSHENQKQSQVLIKFKQKLHQLKMIKEQMNFDQRKLLHINFNKISRFPLTEVTSSIGSQRKKIVSSKPNTAAQMLSKQRSRIASRQYQGIKTSQKGNKLPITFINYKRNKSFAQRFTKDKIERIH